MTVRVWHGPLRCGAVVAAAAMAVSCAGAPSPVPPDGSTPNPDLLWVGDLETGDLAQFQDTPFNIAGGALPPEVVSDPGFVRAGQHALRMTIPGPFSGDGICCGSRAEVQPDIENVQEGDELYVGFSTLLGEGFPLDTSWQLIAQWKHNGDGSPPLELTVEEGRYVLSGGQGHPEGPQIFDKPLGPAVPGEWVDWVMHVKFSPDPGIGFVELWQGGEQVLPAFFPPGGTMYPYGEDGEDPENRLKIGYYRDGDISEPGTVYYDNLRIGTTRAAVETGVS